MTRISDEQGQKPFVSGQLQQQCSINAKWFAATCEIIS